jgi:tetratricopeptide (TPR) repeat protein
MGFGWFLFILVAPVFTGVYSQSLDSLQIDSLMTIGMASLEINRYARAEKAFKQILNDNSSHFVAIEGMANVEMRRKNWSGADGWYRKLLNIDGNYIPALYGFAICKREEGKNAVLLQRALIWKSAKKHFNKALELDSTYLDVLYQTAILERYRENYEEAIRFTHRQLKLKPQLDNVHMGLFRFYDYFLSNRTGKEYEAAEVERWLMNRDTPHDRYALGELYRRKEIFSRAETILKSLLNEHTNFPKQPAYMSLVRLYVEQENPQSANDHYWQAVDTISSYLEAALIVEDMITIMNSNEFGQFHRGLSISELKNAIKKFWLGRDPLPAFSYNYRLIEHYRRLNYVESNYRYDGFRHALDRDDRTGVLIFPTSYDQNFKFSDPGLIYLRYGEPDEKATAVGDLPTNMSWLYYARGGYPQLIFHFTISRNAPANYWTLTPGIVHPDFIESVAHWDMRYQRMLLTNANVHDIHSGFHELANERAEMVAVGFENDRHTWTKELEPLVMNHSAYRFRETLTEDVVQFVFSIDMEDIYKEMDDPDTVEIEAALVIFNKNMDQIHENIRTYSVFNKTHDRIWSNLLIDEFEIPLRLKEYNVALHAKVLGQERLNGWRFQYPLTGKNRRHLGLSSLKLAFEIETKGDPTNQDRQNLKMIPNPTNKFSRRSPVFAYYEIYNLAFNQAGQTDFNIIFSLKQLKRQRNIMQKIGAVFGGGDKYQVSTENREIRESREVSEYISFDMSKAKPGSYILELTLQDNVSGEKSTSSQEFRLY